jgi:V/A-type H+-transporting ATPase subunit E
MNTKIKELTENIYKEGVARAKNEGDQMLDKAHKEAEKTIADANEKAEAMLAEAKNESERIYDSLKKELELVSKQIIEITKQQVNNLVTAKLSEKFASQVTDDPGFLKDMIFEITRDWTGDNHQNKHLEILVPESMIDKLEPLYKTSASKILSSGLVFKPVAGMEKGFQVVNSSEGYKLSFTDKDFTTFFASLIKPKVREFLFNSENQ